MKAMILAAGLGTRLLPLTDTRPKALAEIAGRTLLEITLSRLRSFGVTDVIINVHHFADMIVDYLKSHDNFGMRIEISREDDLLLDTGGGLKKVAWFFLEHTQQNAAPASVIPSGARNPGKGAAPLKIDQRRNPRGTSDEPFILHNVDVLSNIDIRRMLQFHSENRALATLAVQARESSRLLLFNDQLQLCARSGTGTPACAPLATPAQDPAIEVDEFSRRRGLPPLDNPPQTKGAPAPEAPDKQGQQPLHSLAFSGIHVISPRLLPLLTEVGVFSIIEVYLRLSAQGEKILAFRADDYYWRDLGRPSDLSQAALDLQQEKLLGIHKKGETR